MLQSLLLEGTSKLAQITVKGRLARNCIPCLGQTRAKLYTLFRTERTNTIPCPAAHPQYRPYKGVPLLPPGLSDQRRDDSIIITKPGKGKLTLLADLLTLIK